MYSGVPTSKLHYIIAAAANTFMRAETLGCNSYFFIASSNQTIDFQLQPQQPDRVATAETCAAQTQYAPDIKREQSTAHASLVTPVTDLHAQVLQ